MAHATFKTDAAQRIVAGGTGRGSAASTVHRGLRVTMRETDRAGCRPDMIDPARFHASMAMTENDPPENPTPQQVWDARLPMVKLRVSWMKRAGLGPGAVFLASEGAAKVSGAEYEVDAGDSAHNI